MNKAQRSHVMFLEDILLSIDRILEYIDNYSFDDFKKDFKTVDAVTQNFEIIGEASKRIPSDLKEDFPEVPWTEMYLMRNKVAHEYFGVDYEIIWDIAKNHLPENRVQIERIIQLNK
jgi:uncharacterized protein with HEPN domain